MVPQKHHAQPKPQSLSESDYIDKEPDVLLERGEQRQGLIRKIKETQSNYNHRRHLCGGFNKKTFKEARI